MWTFHKSYPIPNMNLLRSSEKLWNRWANELRDLGDSVFSKCMICTPTPVHFVHHRCGYTLGLIPLHKFLKLWNNYRSIGLLFANNLSPWLLFFVTWTDIYGFLCHYSQLFRNYFAIIRNYSQLFANKCSRTVRELIRWNKEWKRIAHSEESWYRYRIY